MAGVIVLVALFVLLLVWVLLGVRIVRPFERGVVERLGRYKQTVEPGLRLIVPLIDKVRIVDMREQVVDVPPQEVITKDNVVVSVDAVVYYEPTDPQRLVYNVANFMLAITKLAQTNLRNLVGDMQLDEALTSRDTINLHLREILDDATDSWGVRVKRVEIQRIDPPADVMTSMHEQMKAERQRRAAVTTADGDRQAAITRADGERQAVILRAQANRESQVLTAQGEAEATRALADAERYKQEAVAHGQAEAIKSVYSAIHEGDPTPDLIAIKYLEALGKVADGQATKIYLPGGDASGLMGQLAGVAELFRDDNGSDRKVEKARTGGRSDPGQLPPPPTSE
jgi:regulator of protease activity HflC (stomatin/prohibitin superfamily)